MVVSQYWLTWPSVAVLAFERFGALLGLAFLTRQLRQLCVVEALAHLQACSQFRCLLVVFILRVRAEHARNDTCVLAAMDQFA